MRRICQWAACATVAFYVVSLVLMAAGRGHPQIGVVGVFGWIVAMALALGNLVVGGWGLGWGGRRWAATAAVALVVFAAGATVTVLLLSSIPRD
jgi:hypothetical protein